MTKWGTPAIDLFYLLYMVASHEARDEHRHDIILHYYREFTKALKDIGFMYKPPGMLDLNIELLRNGFLEVIIAVCFMPFFFINEHSDDIDVAFENGIEGIIFRRKLYQVPSYKSFISKLLSDFLYKGLLN
jgi:hypothetical protein